MTLYTLLHGTTCEALEECFFAHPESYHPKNWDYMRRTFENLRTVTPSTINRDSFYDTLYVFYSENPTPEEGNPEGVISLPSECAGVKDNDFSNLRSTTLTPWSDSLACTVWEGSLDVFGDTRCLLAILDEISFFSDDDETNNAKIDNLEKELDEAMEEATAHPETLTSFDDWKAEWIEKQGGEENYNTLLYAPYGKETYNRLLEEEEVYLALIRCGLTLENPSYSDYDFTAEECLQIRTFLKEGKLGFALTATVAKQFPHKDLFCFINARN